MLAYRPVTVEAGAHTLPREYYTSDEVFRLETERLFAQHWVCVGRADQIPTPGDYTLVHWAGESLIVVRDQAGQVRAHYNVCRHRGSRLCEATSGRLNGAIVCPYHAWTYGLDGALLAARHMQDVEDFDRGAYPLHAAHVAEWEGFLFLNLARPLQPFDYFLAPLIGKFSAWDLPALRLGQRIEYDLQANWKLVVENYSECYHCPLIHPALCRLSPPTSGRNDLLVGPFLGGYMDLEDDVHSMSLSGRASARQPLGQVAGADLARVYYYSIFPNLLLSLHPDYVMAHTLWPLAAGRTRVVCEWYFDPAEVARPDFDPGGAVAFWDLTNREDWRACELTHQGLTSRVYTPGPYAHSEGLLWAFDQEYLKRLGNRDEEGRETGGGRP